jgi:hypothetical protein
MSPSDVWRVAVEVMDVQYDIFRFDFTGHKVGTA